MEQNIGWWLAKRAFLNPDREAYIDSHTGLRLTFTELNSRTNRCANAFKDAGIEKGERVGLLLMNSAEFVEAYFALGKIGAVVVPLNWRLVADELEFILKDAGVTRLIFDDEFVDTVADLQSRGDKTDIHQWLQVEGDSGVAHFSSGYHEFRDAASDAEPVIEAGEDDMLYIMYTSGTTGLPKGVVHTHGTSIWACITLSATTYYLDTDVYLSPLPMFHVGALLPITVNVYRGITSVVMRAFDPVRAWELISEEKITIGLAVPAMLNFMLQVGDLGRFDFRQLRWCMSGAAPVPESLIEAYAELGIAIHQIYGLTETCGPAALIDADNALKRIGSTGKAFFHTDVRVVRGDGTDCDDNEAGEVVVRAPHVMREYWNRPDATAETIIDDWLHTGDVARMDEDGFIYIEDRIKDMIISGGENVYPAEIENVLQAHPGVTEAAVIGQESERWGESPFAIIVRADDALTEADVIEFCRGKLAGFKQPKGVAFVETIPRNPSGKILKRLLREDFPRTGRRLMDLAELEERLGPFARAKYERDDVEISRVHAMPGHAGFAYGFDAQYGGTTDRWFIRLPPPNVNWRGTADVLRQVEVLNALDTTSVPHCSVQWSGDDLEWFGSPYFVVPQLDGDVLRLAPGEWAHDLPIDVRRSIARQSMTALAGIHRVDVSNVPYLGDAVPFRDDVERWDRFYERSADIHLLERAPECRERLLATIPHDAPVGIFHGDFQMSNLFFSPDYQLLAVIDWELTGIGATLNDVGWICTFADRAAWAPSEDGSERPVLLEPDEIVAFYVEAMGEEVPSVDWFRALAAYKFAIISGLNLSLHRRGKRHDPTWEVGRLSMPTLIDRALELLN